jgi:hypothetical protein
MRFALTLVFCCVCLEAQQTAPGPVPPSSAPAATPTASNVTWFPKLVLTAGGGFSSPNGKFSYASESSYLGAGTYATVAIEETIINKQVQTCTLAGVTKPMYQFGLFTVGLTGLGGGCTSTSGAATGSASGQGFVDLRWGKHPYGNTLTATKNTTGGWKATLAFRWAK